ncbi:hypothetical protein FRC19_010931 [Serendipita sp. 401]|nr:hypothetical protein FRC19_010931 [Serendipita sp. 401]
MEHIPATNRVPVEIWEEILTLALRTWLLPGSGDNILDDFLLFSGGCESNMEYRRVESIRRRLRAVCKSWKVVVEDFDVGLTVSDLAKTTVPSESHLNRAMRIEFPSTYACTCMRCPYKFSNHLPTALRQYLALRHSSSPPFDSVFKPNNARIVSLSLSHRDMAEYLQYAPRLTAFGGESSLFHDGKTLKMQSILERLTHLSVSGLSPGVMSTALFLPRLRFLHLMLIERTVSGGYISLDRWELPNLTSLVLDGSIEEGETLHNDLLQFCHNHCTHIENLIIQYEGARPPSIDVHNLKQYSRLRVLGVRFRTLDPSISRVLLEKDASMPPLRLTLFLSDSSNLHMKSRRRLLSTARQCVLLCTPPISLFDKIVLAQSWNQLIYQWDTEEQQDWEGEDFRDARFSDVWVFFKELRRAEVRVIDRDGLRLGEGDGLRFLERCRHSSRQMNR